jgi:hypothetical protein
MPDANTLADELATAIENFFGLTCRDKIEALVPQRAAIDADKRARLLAALHRVQEQAVNVCAALTRDAAWG